MPILYGQLAASRSEACRLSDMSRKWKRISTKISCNIETVWAAAGTPNAIFELKTEDLQKTDRWKSCESQMKDIYNYLYYNEKLSSSGMPTATTVEICCGGGCERCHQSGDIEIGGRHCK